VDAQTSGDNRTNLVEPLQLTMVVVVVVLVVVVIIHTSPIGLDYPFISSPPHFQTHKYTNIQVLTRIYTY
jgi:hypothetical protein